MRYIIYVPATLLPAVHHSSTRRRVITSFGPYSTLRTRVLCKSSFSCLRRRIIRKAVSSLGPLWSPLTAIVPVPPNMPPLGYLRPGDSAAERKLSQPVTDTLNPFGSILDCICPTGKCWYSWQISPSFTWRLNILRSSFLARGVPGLPFILKADLKLTLRTKSPEDRCFNCKCFNWKLKEPRNEEKLIEPRIEEKLIELKSKWR